MLLLYSVDLSVVSAVAGVLINLLATRPATTAGPKAEAGAGARAGAGAGAGAGGALGRELRSDLCKALVLSLRRTGLRDPHCLLLASQALHNLLTFSCTYNLVVSSHGHESGLGGESVNIIEQRGGVAAIVDLSVREAAWRTLEELLELTDDDGDEGGNKGGSQSQSQSQSHVSSFRRVAASVCELLASANAIESREGRK